MLQEFSNWVTDGAKCSVFFYRNTGSNSQVCVTDALMRDLNSLKILAESVNIIDKASATDALVLA